MTRISLISLLLNAASIKGNGKLVCIEFWWTGKYPVPQILIWVCKKNDTELCYCPVPYKYRSHIPLTCTRLGPFLLLRIFWLAKAQGSQVRSIKIISTEFQLSIKSSEPCNDTGMLAELLRGDLVN